MFKYTFFIPNNALESTFVFNWVNNITTKVGGVTVISASGEWYENNQYYQDKLGQYIWITHETIEEYFPRLIELMHEAGEKSVLWTKEEIEAHFE